MSPKRRGLGVPDLITKNKSLLKKFLFKFHCSPPAPWIDWLRQQYGWNDDFDFGDDHPSITPIWKDIYTLLPSFREETKVIVGNGRMTAFWNDLWWGAETLANFFPALFSHTLCPNASVARVLSSQVPLLALRPRLTHVAEAELLELQSLMASVHLNPEAMDRRVLRKNGKVPTPRDHYLISFDSMPDDPFARAIWRSYAPQKCKFFLWLMHRERLSTNARLHYCNMQPSGQCPSCPSEEDCFHLFIACLRSTSFWNYCGIDVSLISQSFGVEQLWLENPLQENNSRIKSTILTCLLWNIWKCRTTVIAKVFRQEDEPNAVIAKRCREDLILWSNRCSSPSEKMKIVELSCVFPLE